MCQQQRPGLSLTDLPKCGAGKIEEFADSALSVFNVAVYPVGRQVDKARGDFGQQRLEPEMFRQFRPVLPALQGINKDTAQQAQPGDILFRPGLMPACVLYQNYSRDPATGGQGDGQCGFDSHSRKRLPVPQSFFRKIPQPADVEILPLHQSLGTPWKQFDEVYLPRYLFNAFAILEMRDSGKGLVFLDFQQTAPIDLEELHDPSQGIVDLAVDLIERDGHEPCRKVKQQRLKAQPLLQALFRCHY